MRENTKDLTACKTDTKRTSGQHLQCACYAGTAMHMNHTHESHTNGVFFWEGVRSGIRRGSETHGVQSGAGTTGRIQHKHHVSWFRLHTDECMVKQVLSMCRSWNTGEVHSSISSGKLPCV